MSFIAKLHVDDQQYNVLRCNYSFDQPMDGTGKPAGKPRGGQISLTVESEGRQDLHLWMKEADQTKDGALIFYKRDAMSHFQKVEFTKAFCVKLSESFDSNSTKPMQKHLVISAQTIKIGAMEYENPWGA